MAKRIPSETLEQVADDLELLVEQADDDEREHSWWRYAKNTAESLRSELDERAFVETLGGRFDNRKPGRAAPISAFDQARLMPLTFTTGKTIEQLLADERAGLL